MAIEDRTASRSIQAAASRSAARQIQLGLRYSF
jgi:hypothetical protein